MNKTIKFTVSIIFIILIIAGSYLWYSNREIRGSMQDYEIKSYLGETVVENKKAGFSFKAPSGWETEVAEGLEGSVISASLTTEGANGTSGINSETPLSDGCLIEATVTYNVLQTFEEMKPEIEEFRYVFSGADSCEFEMSEVNGIGYLRNYYTSPYVGPGIAAYFKGVNNKVYAFCLYYPIDADEDQKSQCVNDFDEFLETVEINK